MQYVLLNTTVGIMSVSVIYWLFWLQTLMARNVQFWCDRESLTTSMKSHLVFQVIKINCNQNNKNTVTTLNIILSFYLFYPNTDMRNSHLSQIMSHHTYCLSITFWIVLCYHDRHLEYVCKLQNPLCDRNYGRSVRYYISKFFLHVT